jgi:hypothetical protein
LLDGVEHRFERLVAVARDADHDRLVARDAPLLDELLRDRDGRAAGGLVKMPSVRASSWMPFDDLLSVTLSPQPPDSRTAFST